MLNTTAQHPTTNSCARAARLARTALTLLGALVLAGLMLDTSDALGHGSSKTAPLVNQSSQGSATELTRRLLALHAEWQRGDEEARAAAMKSLVNVAAAREQRLLELIVDQPDAVLREAMPARTRASLPAAIRGFVETEETLEGDLEVFHEDGFAGSRYRYFLAGQSDRVELHFASDPPELETGDRVRIRGLKVRGHMALSSGRTQMTVLAAALPNTLGEQKTLVILVNFQDKPTQTWVSPAQAKGIVFTDATSVSNFFFETSYEQTWLTGDAVGVFTIATNSSNCDTNGIANQARQAASNAGANLSNYRRLVYAFPSNSGCGWWGLGSVGGNPSQAWINGSFQNGVVAHEMGHNLGLYHSHALECGTTVIGSSCTNIEYGDTMDTMGSAVPPKHFNAPQKERLGWLNYGISPPITTVQSDGVYTIDPIETMGTGPKALRVKTPAGDWYYVEYRQAFGFDASTVANNTNVRTGVLVHLWLQQSPNSIYLLDMTAGTTSWNDPALAVNGVFTDSAAGISISPVWAEETAGVNITVGGGGGGPTCVEANPGVAISPPSQQGAPGEALTYSVSITNKDSACPTATFGASAALPSGWTATFTPSTLNLGPGATGTTSMKVTSSAAAPSGNNTISAVATNTGDTAFKGSGAATYQVQADVGGGSFTDDFNRPNASILGNGWSKVGGTLSIQSNQVVTGTARSTHMAVQGGLTGATQNASARFASMNNSVSPRFAVLVRYQDPKNYYMCYRQANSGALGIARVANGAETILKSISAANPTKGQLFTLGCQAQGSTITLSLNGAGKVSVANATAPAGKVGVAVGYPSGRRGGAAHRIDDFTATAQ